MEKIQELETMRKQIEKMSKHNQVEILRILKSCDEEITLNENSYGVFVNLSDLSESIIGKLLEYIKYWNNQENNLKKIETKKESYKTIYFSNNIKDNSISYSNAEQSI